MRTQFPGTAPLSAPNGPTASDGLARPGTSPGRPRFGRVGGFQVLLLALAWMVTGPSAAAEKLTVAPVLKEVTPAVVNISVRGRRMQQNPLMDDPFFRRFFNNPGRRSVPVQGIGSGVIIDGDDGLVVTNHHVVNGAEEIVVTLRDRREFEATLVGSDPATDVALLRIDAEDLVGLPPGDSDSLEVGDFVVAIGNPFGLGQTVTLGIVSALGRTGLGLADRPDLRGYEDFIQTDASINRGNSGGALVDLDGRLVGINTAISSPSGGSVGIGFAVPTRMVKAVVEQLLAFGEVRRGVLGVVISNVEPDVAEALGLDADKGAVVSQVMEDSAAEEADIRPYDVIVSINDEAVDGAADLRNRIGLIPVGEEVEVGLLRDGERLEKRIVIGEREAVADAGDASDRFGGAEFRDIGPQHPLHGEVEGVEVARVDPGSGAARAGLRPGDIILHVNRRPVSNTREFFEIVKAAEGALALYVQRGNARAFVALP